MRGRNGRGFVQSNSPGIGSVFGRAAQPSFWVYGGISSTLHTASITRGSGGEQSLDSPNLLVVAQLFIAAQSSLLEGIVSHTS